MTSDPVETPLGVSAQAGLRPEPMKPHTAWAYLVYGGFAGAVSAFLVVGLCGAVQAALAIIALIAVCVIAVVSRMLAITKQREAYWCERAVTSEAERKQLFRVIDSLPVRVYWKNRDSVYLGCNTAFAMDARLEHPGEAVFRTDFDMPWPREEAEAFRVADAEVIGRGLAMREAGKHTLLTGQPAAYYDTSRMPLEDEMGRVVGVVGTYEDVSEQKRMESRLRRIQAALEDASDAILTTDRNRHPDFMNASFMDAFRHTQLTLAADGVQSIFKDRELAHGIFKAIWSFESWEGEVTLCGREGVEFPALLRVTPILDDHIEIIGALLVINDITERKHMEQQLLQSQKLESIGQLAAGIAHEINTPIQYVGDNARFLKDCFEDFNRLNGLQRELASAAKGHENLDKLVRAVEECATEIDIEYLEEEVPRAVTQSLEGIEHVAGILRAMKNYSHPGLEDKTAVDLNEAISSTITIARSEWKYVAEMETNFDDTLPLVVCQPGEINQAVLNLIINAAHAISEKAGENSTEKGVISVSTRRQGEWAEVRISDTGTGIPPEVQGRIFDPFFTTKDVGKGTGQGLSIAHSVITEKHGGSLTFETELGKGTTFVIRLPAEASAETGRKLEAV